jgi:hypothetical protein
MNRDELRENLIAIFVRRGHRGKEIVEEAKEILSLIDPELEKARKWDRTVEMAKDKHSTNSQGDEINYEANMIVDAIEKESR